MDNRRTLNNGDNGSFIDASVSGQFTATKTGAASSTTSGPAKFAGGISANNTSWFNGLHIPSPALTTRGFGTPNNSGNLNGSAAINPFTYYKPTDLFIQRSGLSGTTTDTFPATSTMIANIEAAMPNGVWDIGQSYQICYYNGSTQPWQIERTDGNFIWGTGGTVLAGAGMGFATGKLSIFTFLRFSSTQIIGIPSRS